MFFLIQVNKNPTISIAHRRNYEQLVTDITDLETELSQYHDKNASRIPRLPIAFITFTRTGK